MKIHPRVLTYDEWFRQFLEEIDKLKYTFGNWDVYNNGKLRYWFGKKKKPKEAAIDFTSFWLR